MGKGVNSSISRLKRADHYSIAMELRFRTFVRIYGETRTRILCGTIKTFEIPRDEGPHGPSDPTEEGQECLTDVQVWLQENVDIWGG